MDLYGFVISRSCKDFGSKPQSPGEFHAMTKTVVFLILSVASGTILQIQQGWLQGKRERRVEVVSYLGVPFAEPPIGHLRFRPPVPHGGWNGTYRATEQKLPCLQPEKFKKLLKTQNFSEDCLYLNIHAPIGRSELKPVS